MVGGNPSEKRSVRSARRAARRETAAVRDVDADDRALADTVRGFLAEHGIGPGSTVTLYESIPGEPPTAATLQGLARQGIRVLLPITLPDLDLDWFAAEDPDRRPLGLDAIAQADLVLTPGLSVDQHGTRIGQGGGCYDKALPRRRPGVVVATLLHPGEHIGADLPREAHDQPVDWVLTASGSEPAATDPSTPS